MNEKIKITTLLVVYASLLGVCYLQGFWSTFQINVFQYADLLDVLKATVLPLSLLLFGSALGFFSSFGLHIAPQFQFAPPENGTTREKIGSALVRFKPLIVTLWGIAATAVYYGMDAPVKWMLLTFMSFPLAVDLNRFELTRSLIPNSSIRRAVGLLIFSAPLMSLSAGSYEADLLTRGKGKYILDTASFPSGSPARQYSRLEYIGIVGSTFFLFDTSSKALLVMKQNDNIVMVLKPNPASKCPGNESTC